MYDRETLLAKVAMMHYENGYTQTRISKELGISRPTIAAYLKEAIDKEIVQIIISHPNKDVFTLEKKLQNKYPDTEILVSNPSNGNKKEAVGLAAAQLLDSLLPTVTSVGIGWGTTLAELVHATSFKKIKGISIFPLIGGMVTSDVKYHSNYLVTELAQKTSGKAGFLYAPAIADSHETKLAFEKIDAIKDVLTAAKNVDLALIGIGNPLINSNYREHGHLSDDEIESLNKEDAIGDIITTFFNSNGEIVNTDLSDRMIGLNVDDLSNIKKVMAVATGNEKTVSTKIVLEKKLATHLIIDQDLAVSILEQVENDDKQEHVL